MSDQVQITCPYCGVQAVFYATSRHLYGGVDLGSVYACMPCGAWVGVNKQTGLPHGTLANRELRQWRSKAHRVFDPLWKRSGKSRAWQFGKRTALYKWLARELGRLEVETHIGMFDVETCKQVIKLCWARRKVEI